MAKITLDIPIRSLDALDEHVEFFEYDNRATLIREILRGWLKDNRDELAEQMERVGVDESDDDEE